MEHLPPVGWADVTTKKDLDHQAILFKSQLDQGFAAARAEMDQRFAAHGADMDQRFAAVRAETTAEITAVRSEMAEGFAEVDRHFRKVDERFVQIDLRLERQEGEFALLREAMDSLANKLRAELHRGLRLHLLTLAGFGATAAGVLLAALRMT